MWGKKKKKYKFAYNHRSQHITATFKRGIFRTKGIKITHGNKRKKGESEEHFRKRKGKGLVPLHDNPNKSDPRPSFISRRIIKGPNRDFSYDFKNRDKYVLSKENENIMNNMLKKKKKDKKDSCKKRFKKLLKKLLRK